jgi:Transposase DDE domain group 1
MPLPAITRYSYSTSSVILERCALRPGNVHSADAWVGVLKPVVARYQGKVSRIYFRADAVFAMPEVYEFLEAERINYAIRLPANQILQHRIGYLLKRPVGRPSNEERRFHANFIYQAHAVRLQLHALAYNLGNFLRTLATLERLRTGR